MPTLFMYLLGIFGVAIFFWIFSQYYFYSGVFIQTFIVVLFACWIYSDIYSFKKNIDIFFWIILADLVADKIQKPKLGLFLYKTLIVERKKIYFA